MMADARRCFNERLTAGNGHKKVKGQLDPCLLNYEKENAKEIYVANLMKNL